MTLPNIKVVEDFLPLMLGCINLILGMKWLGTLGQTQVDWGKLRMKFMVDGHSVVLQGDSSLQRAQVSIKSKVKKI